MKNLMILLLAGALAVSLIGNYFLFRKALDFYAREAEVRMNPVSERYAQQNAALLQEENVKPRVVIFGESRAAMWRSNSPEQWGDIQIVNRGIGGETTPQIKARLAPDVIALQPDLVVMQMGDNDLKTIAVLPGTRNSAIASTYANITEMARRLSDQGIHVVITTIFPPAPAGLLRKPLWSEEVNAAIDTVNQQLLEFDYPGVAVVDCDPILRDGKYVQDDYAIDTLHLKPAAYQALNEALAPTIRALLDRP